MDIKQTLIKYLTENSRYTNKQLASMIGVTETEVETAITELEKSGAIVKYTTIINPDKFETGRVDALINVKVKPQKLKGFDAFAEQLCKYDEVKGLYLISGAFDLAVMITAKDLNGVARFVSETLSAVDGVIEVSTNFILKKYKIEGQTTKGENEDRVLIWEVL